MMRDATRPSATSAMRRSTRCIATTLKRHTHGELYKTVITCHHQNPAKNICLLYFQVPRSPLASSPLIASVGIMPSCPIPVWDKFPEVQGRFNIDTWLEIRFLCTNIAGLFEKWVLLDISKHGLNPPFYSDTRFTLTPLPTIARKPLQKTATWGKHFPRWTWKLLTTFVVDVTDVCKSETQTDDLYNTQSQK